MRYSDHTGGRLSKGTVPTVSDLISLHREAGGCLSESVTPIEGMLDGPRKAWSAHIRNTPKQYKDVGIRKELLQ